MTTNNSQLFLNNFGGYDLFSKADPAQIADLMIEDAIETAQFTVTQDGSHKAKIFNQVVPDTQISIRASDVKNDNLRLYNALLRAGNDLGTATLNRGNTTTTYKIFNGEKPMIDSGNPASYAQVNLKFIKQ